MESDSTIVYYEFIEGLHKLDLSADNGRKRQSARSYTRKKQYSNIRKIYTAQIK